MIETVSHAQDAIRMLILGKDYISALEILDNLNYHCSQQNLSQFKCLQHLPDTLSTIITEMKKSLNSDFYDKLFLWDQSHLVIEKIGKITLENCSLMKALHLNFK